MSRPIQTLVVMWGWHVRSNREEASIQMKADSEHDVHRCAFTLFVNCQFLALITVCNCQAGLVFGCHSATVRLEHHY